MPSEKEILTALGNSLLRIYSGITGEDVTAITKWTFRDYLIKDIATHWNINYTQLPAEGAFYNAFRKNNCPTGMLEKLAIFYYAYTDKEVAKKMNALYLDIATRQRMQITPHWNRFILEETAANNPAIPLPQQHTTHTNLNQQIQQLTKGMQKMQAMLQQALTEAEKKDAYIKKEFNMLKQQRLADDLRIRELEQKFNHFTATSQTPETQWQQASEYFKQYNFTAYQNTLDESIAGNVTTVAEAYYLKALGYEATLQYANALKAYQTAQNLQPQNPVYTKALGHLLYLIADYNTAIEILNNALQLVQQNPAHKTLESSILNNIGSCFFEKDKFDTAIGYFTQALNINKQNKGKTDSSLSDSYNLLGLCYMEKADYKKADECYSKAYDLCKQKHGTQHTNMATILNHWGLALRNQNDFKTSIEYFNRAIEIDKEKLGENHPRIANYLNNIAEVWREQSKYDDAIEYYTRALNIYRSVFPNGHPKIAGFLNNIGMALVRKGERQRGIQYYRDSLQLNKKFFGEYHTAIGNNYNNLGLVFHELEEHELALENYNKALTVYTKIHGKTHPDIARVYGNMGGVFHSQNKFAEALRYYKLSEKMYRKHFSNPDSFIAYPIANTARVYDAQGLHNKAIKYYEQASQLFENGYGPESINVAHINYNLGQTWRAKGNRKKSIAHFEKALRIFKKIVGDSNPYTVKCQNDLNEVQKEKS